VREWQAKERGEGAKSRDKGESAEISQLSSSLSRETSLPCLSLISSPITSPAPSSTLASSSSFPLAALFATSSTLGSSSALNANPRAFASISTGVQMERMTLWREKGRETEEKPPRSIRLKSRTSCGAQKRSETFDPMFKKTTDVEHLRHHLQRALERSVFDGRFRRLVERLRASKVLHGEQSGVEGYSHLVEDVIGELSR
jgi:hypothetical protein